MEALQSLSRQLATMQWSDFLDILIVAFLFYKLLPLLRGSGSVRIAGVVAAILVLSWLTATLELKVLNFLIKQVMQVGLIAVVILFQPEIRRVLDHLGRFKLSHLLGTAQPEQEMVPVITQVVHACDQMSRDKVGALIVFSRQTRLDEYYKSGTMIDGQVSHHLIRNIFFPNSALHDGAMIIHEGRVAAASCVLPLSATNRLSEGLGTRHRAAVGMSEVSDAVVVVVSEETGTISAAIGGSLKRHLAPQTLEKLLRNELCREDSEQEGNKVQKLVNRAKNVIKEGKRNEK